MLNIRYAIPLAVLLVGAACETEPRPQSIAVDAEHLGLPAIVLENDVLELKTLEHGGAFVSLVLKDDPERNNPLWDPLQARVEAGEEVTGGVSTGHFVCIDGFGRSSDEEQAAGFGGHGEANKLHWTTEASTREGGRSRMVQSVELPIVQETVRRTVEAVDGENVLYVDTEVTSHLGFDRPLNWAEHATIGSPFLERGVTVVDLSPNRALTRTYEERANRRLASGKEFNWPMAPLIDGAEVDLRAAPAEDKDSLAHTTHLVTVGGETAWVTALHPGKRLLLGYVWSTEEFPWMQSWESYPAEGTLARGLEFSTQAFGTSRRDVISQGKIFDTPLFRWLPAKSTITARYLMFWTRVPEGFTGVSDVSVADRMIAITDSDSVRKVTLAASLAE